MVQYVPGKWSDYASHRQKSAWQEQGGRHSAKSTEVAALLVSWENVPYTMCQRIVWRYLKIFHTAYSDCRHWCSLITWPISTLQNYVWAGGSRLLTADVNSPDLMPPEFFVWGGTSSHLCTDKDHRMKLTSDKRSLWPLHRSLQKYCVPRGATCPCSINCAASAMAVMLSVNVLGHESVCTINW